MDSRGLAHEHYDKLHIFICMIVAIVVITVCLIRRETLFTMALWTSVAIVLFWFLGNMVRYYIITQVFPPPPEEEFVFDESMLDEMGEEGMEEMAEAAADGTPAPKPPPLPKPEDFMSRE
ncbi:MAG: hypothetical protein FWC16_13040 [Defluviitaleaceae bacterium]|nr:hypothetical protein [Defluviitaleaceae bacterium]MCL2275846.1 hypothetical protein [Defluviitaleaceae bacterium]